MGLKSGARSEDVAKDLEKVLQKGVETKNPEIISFLKKHIYPMYKIHCSESNYLGKLPWETMKHYN